eukprot:COSAG02_NODE_46837_length_345_cov_1.686992_1_plen_99_part_10
MPPVTPMFPLDPNRCLFPLGKGMFPLGNKTPCFLRLVLRHVLRHVLRRRVHRQKNAIQHLNRLNRLKSHRPGFNAERHPVEALHVGMSSPGTDSFEQRL